MKTAYDQRAKLRADLGKRVAAAGGGQLELGRLCLRNEMEDKAKAIIRQLIARYGSTKAAHDAKILLMTFQPMEE